MFKVPVDPQKRFSLRRSFTRWDQFVNRCPQLYARGVLDPVWVDSPAQQRGKQVHTYLERCIQAFRSNQEQPPAPVAGPCSADELLGYWKRVEELVHSWDEILGVEEWINVVHELPWSGKIDAHVVEGGKPTIVDWKTCGSLTFTKDNFEAGLSLQHWIYCGAKPDTARAQFVYLPPKGPIKVVTAEFTPEEQAYHRAWIHHTDQLILDAWKRAGGTLGVDKYGAPVVSFPSGKADLSVFAFAPTEMRWCDSRYCQRWKECRGRIIEATS